MGGQRPGQASYTSSNLLTLSLPQDLGHGALLNSTLILSASGRNGVDLSATAIGNQFTDQQILGGQTLALSGRQRNWGGAAACLWRVVHSRGWLCSGASLADNAQSV